MALALSEKPAMVLRWRVQGYELPHDNQNKWVKILVGALGFEPRLAGFFRSARTRSMRALGSRRVGAPVGHQIHQIPTRRHSRATGARGTTRLYYTPVGVTLRGATLL